MVSRLRSRGVATAVGFFMLAVSSSANAQNSSTLNVSAAVKSVEAEAAKPIGTAQSVANNLLRPAVAVTTAIATTTSAVLQSQPTQSVTAALAPSIATEAAWLYKNGWPLYALVDRYSTTAQLDEETNCLATAVYFEARGESLEGQLAVARVVMNRAASGRYATDWCGVVKQPSQFSFVRHGQFPSIAVASAAWAKAEAIARLAVANVVPSVDTSVLWYHADYVAPKWGHQLNVVEKIGAHIFYRA